MQPLESTTNIPHAMLSALPSELLLHILSYLDIPDLLTLSRTTQHLRALTLDPLLHTHRLQRASVTLSRAIPSRPPLAELMARRVYITRTTLAARNLGRNLIMIKLNRQLGRRPSVERLVELGVLPAECFGGRSMAPGLVVKKRMVEREKLRDFLRGWVGEWGKRGGEMVDPEGEQRIDVGIMATQLRRDMKNKESAIWGPRTELREAPMRPKILGFRRFWEKVGKESVDE